MELPDFEMEKKAKRGEMTTMEMAKEMKKSGRTLPRQWGDRLELGKGWGWMSRDEGRWA